jgi:hypothetical protein
MRNDNASEAGLANETVPAEVEAGLEVVSRAPLPLAWLLRSRFGRRHGVLGSGRDRVGL